MLSQKKSDPAKILRPAQGLLQSPLIFPPNERLSTDEKKKRWVLISVPDTN